MTASSPRVLRSGRATPDESSQFRAVFFNVAPAMFLGSLDQTIVAAALPAIAGGLGDIADIAWIVTSYLLAATIAAPIYGRLGDAIGRQRALCWALGLFFLGSLVCAAAPTLPVLIGARGLQGLGGGGLMTLAQALIGEVVSPKERGRFQGWFGSIFALASTLGPVTGGFLAERLGWRAIFWVNVPLCVIAFFAVSRLKASTKANPFSIDFKGGALFIIATVALLLALSFGSSMGWSSIVVIVTAGIALIGYVLLWPTELRSVDPLLPPTVLSNPVIWRATLCVLLFAAVLFAAIVQIPLFLQVALDFSPAASGLMLIPLTLAQVVVSTATGMRISTTGRPNRPMVTGLAATAVGFGLLAAMLGQGALAICVSVIVLGLGLGSTMPAAQMMVQWAAGPTHLGIATATLSFSRSVGGVLGTALASAILLAALERLAPGQLGRIQEATSATSSGASTSALSAPQVLDGFRFVFISLALIATLAASLAQSIEQIDLTEQPAELGANQ